MAMISAGRSVLFRGTLASCIAVGSLLTLAAGCGSGSRGTSGENVGTISNQLTGGAVLVNPLGYRTTVSKVAVVYGSGCNGRAFSLLQGATALMTGTTSAAITDPGSGDTVCKADFSSYVTAATGLTVSVSGLGTSQSFAISSTDQYPSLYENAMSYFTYHRLGSGTVSITLPGSTGTNVSRSWAMRPVDATGLSAYNGWTNYTFLIDGGHADAGDFGLYPENASHAMWVLMNLYELKAPNTALRDEAAYGVKFFTGILPSDTTMQATHKCHDDSWGTQNWGGYPSGNDVSNGVRHCMGQSITATYAMARALAQASRMLKSSDSATADSYWTLAQSAWNRANKALTPTYNGPSPGAAIGGGDYQDTDATDDLFDAAVEMYLTAKSRAASYTAYLPTVTASTWYKHINRANFDWQYDANDGNLSLMAYHLAKGSLAGEIDTAGLQTAITAEADNALGTIAANGYPTPIAGNDYPWGSNKIVANSSIILAYAHTLTGQAKYLNGIHQSMDYLMGVNTLGFGYITGYGTTFVKATHDRQANGNSPIGWLSGGPINASEVNDTLTPKTSFGAKNYYTTDSGWDNAWCSKENAIDWNAPLAWMAWYMRNPAGSASGDTTAPTAPASPTTSGITSNAVTLSWTASTDNVGVTGYKLFNGATQVGTTTTTSYQFTGLAASTAYTLGVQAYDAAGNNSTKTTASATTSASSATNLALNKVATASSAQSSNPITAGNDSSTTSRWCAADGNLNNWWQVDLGAAYSLTGAQVMWEMAGRVYGYKIEVSSDGSTWTMAADQTGNTLTTQTQSVSFTATGRYVRITVTGLASSTWASFFDFQVFGSGGTSDTQAPTAPTSPTTSGITSSAITLNWAASTDNVGVTGYKLFNGATQVGTTTTTSYQFTGLAASTAYTLGVQAYDAAGNNSTKTTASATTSASSDTTAPTAPSSLTTSGITSSAITLNWTASTDNVGVTGYKVYKGGVLVTTLSGTSLSYQFTGLTASTAYTLGVAATDAAGNNSTTSSSNATTSAASGGTNPCATLCSNPVVFTTASYSSGNLGSGATCHEFVGTLNGGNFGNFVAPRTFSVNGVNMGSAGGNLTLPARLNGGYCFQATAGSYDYAYFGTW